MAGRGQIHLVLDGKCLTDPGNRTGNGTRVNVANCQAGPAQHWAVASDGTLRVHNHCLEIAGQGGAAGQQVQLWQCNGSTREVWMQGTAGELVNPASGLCLTGFEHRAQDGQLPHQAERGVDAPRTAGAGFRAGQVHG